MSRRIFLFLFIASNLLIAQTTKIHHNLKVKINPAASEIYVDDEITIAKEIAEKGFEFLLNKDLSAESKTEGITLKSPKRFYSASDLGMDRETDEPTEGLLLRKYIVSPQENLDGDLTFSVVYKGKIKSEIKQNKENYQRGFSESPGIIDEIGIYLAGSTYWIPTFGEELVSFKLTSELPEGWKTVSQGKRISEEISNGKRVDVWDSPTPQEEIFLIGAKFNEYHGNAGSVDIYAFLRTPDEALANKYIDVTAQYMEMYRQLIGPFPYTKFALVENFWETGYGMPSFTLLGEKIIRFPFILHSSYPHELLHNWWGNSVYVDFSKGNWCEGITAYMADHLIKEQRGRGEEYRRSTMQKFTDFVNEKNDFPLSKFLSRRDGPSEAIGYGKTLMMFHMLRRMVGDENFIKSFQVFYRNNKFKKASFDDIRAAFEETTGKDLNLFFHQWVERKGAPKLDLTSVSQKKKNGKFVVEFELKQTQKEDPFVLEIPVAFVTQNGTKTEIFKMFDRTQKFEMKLDAEAYKILVDPQYDVFRRLDANEIPVAFTKAYGAEKTLMILPAQSSSNFKLYEDFAKQWSDGKEENFEIKTDDEINSLPSDRAVWIFGFENKYAKDFNKGLKLRGSEIMKDSVKFETETTPKGTNSFFAAIKNEENIEQPVLFLAIGDAAAEAGLLRKLPHYGKYGYLAFEGTEPSNIVKGIWQVQNSPMIKVLDKRHENVQPQLEKREPLAKLAPVFSAKRMLETVKYLSSDKLKGRGIGTPELDDAAQFIIEKFKEYGLQPGADDGSYVQSFTHNFPKLGDATLKNIIGIIPGTNPKFDGQAVVVSAHYDHLGLGYPDVHKGDEGKIHHGADDNASGIAVMLELAKTMGKSFKPSRTIIFVAFSGEEEGLIGSKYFVENYKKFPADKLFADLNIDTVGRLFGNKLMILGGSSAREWRFIFMGTEYTTGVPSVMVTQELDASDQVSFIQKGIPGVQFFSGPNEDYHRPTDTADKIDPAGMVKTATVIKETLGYLSEREEPLTFTGKTGKADKEIKPANGKPKTGRRVSTGIMPDFAYSGEGVKIGGVSSDSPAAKAGLVKGDVIKKFDGKEVKTLREYSDYLKKHSPGDIVILTVERNGQIIEARIKLAER
ncbi:MAG: M20/M25/M40 family metallo-hydrolase [Chlorobi bacterium]|nr:M20/M25/M40 family metallo-hydrolase [Chlorobiota bacterium]